MPISDVELGSLLTKVELLEKQLAEQGKKIDEMREVILAARGSWKTLVMVGGIASVVGGIIAKVWPFH